MSEYPEVQITADVILKLAWPTSISEVDLETMYSQSFNTIEVRLNREQTTSAITKFKEIVERLENVVRLMQS